MLTYFYRPLSDLLIFVMLLPSVITLLTILLNKYRTHRQVHHAPHLLIDVSDDASFPVRQRQRDRAPREAVLSLPEAIWIPEQWEKEDDSPSPMNRTREGTGTAGMDPSEATTSTIPSTPSDDPSATTAPDPNPSVPPHDPTKPKPKPGVRRKYYSKDECSICLGSFERGDVIRILPCGHLFHKKEVDDWLVKWKKVVSSYLRFWYIVHAYVWLCVQCPVCRMYVVQQKVLYRKADLSAGISPPRRQPTPSPSPQRPLRLHSSRQITVDQTRQSPAMLRYCEAIGCAYGNCLRGEGRRWEAGRTRKYRSCDEWIVCWQAVCGLSRGSLLRIR